MSRYVVILLVLLSQPLFAATKIVYLETGSSIPAAVASFATDGGTIYLAPGTYTVGAGSPNGNLVISEAPVTLVGSVDSSGTPATTVELIPDSTTSTQDVAIKITDQVPGLGVSFDRGSNSEIRNIKVTVNPQDLCDDPQTTVVENNFNCFVDESSAAGIEVDGAEFVVINNVYIDGFGDAVRDTAYEAMSISPFAIKIHTSALADTSTFDCADWLKINNVKLTNNYRGFVATGCSNGYITGTLIENTGPGAGVYIERKGTKGGSTFKFIDSTIQSKVASTGVPADKDYLVYLTHCTNPDPDPQLECNNTNLRNTNASFLNTTSQTTTKHFYVNSGQNMWFDHDFKNGSDAIVSVMTTPNAVKNNIVGPYSKLSSASISMLTSNFRNHVWNSALDVDDDGFYVIDDLDDDNDGMLDDWESQYGFNPLDASDAIEDFDEDGVTNVAEFISNTSPAAIDTNNDGLSDDWEQQLDGYTAAIDDTTSTVDFPNDNIEYFRFYFSSDDALVAYPAHDALGHNGSIPECELVVELSKPANWSGKKVIIEYPAGGWMNGEWDEDGHQAGNYPLAPLEEDDNFLTINRNWIDADYLGAVVTWRSPGSDRNCLETGTNPATWEDVVHDAQEALYHIILTIPEFLAPGSSYPDVYLIGGSAGGHMVTMMAVHGLDQLQIPGWIMNTQTAPVGRSIITRVLSGNGPVDFARMRNECVAYNLNYGNLEHGRTLAVPTPIYGGVGKPIIETTETIPNTVEIVDRLFDGVEVIHNLACDVDSDFMLMGANDEFLVYNRLGDWYHQEYSPQLLLIQGTGDGIVPPEMAIGACDDVAGIFASTVTFESSLSMDSRPGATNSGYIEQFHCGSPTVRMDLGRDIGHFFGPSGYGTSSYTINGLNYVRSLRAWLEGDLFDMDFDGVEDNWERQQFGDLGFNPSSIDPGHGLHDEDGDGLTNFAEYQNFTDLSEADTDGDNLSDSAELNVYYTSPLDVDTDSDDLPDDNEINILLTDPNNPDMDNDAFSDGSDNCAMISNNEQLDEDLDGYGNACDGDFNNDSVVDIVDLRLLINQGFGAWVNTAVGDIPATTIPHINKVASEIDQQMWHQWVGEGASYEPGPSGLGCAGTIPCPAQ